MHPVYIGVNKIELVEKLILYRNLVNLIFPRRALDAKYLVNTMFFFPFVFGMVTKMFKA